MRFTTSWSARARGNLALVVVAACLELVAPYVVATAATTPPQVRAALFSGIRFFRHPDTLIG